MVALNTLTRPVNRLDDASESFLAHLTEAAYGVALKHGIKGSFADLELDLWRELRRVSVRFVNQNIPIRALAALVSRNGGEVVNLE